MEGLRESFPEEVEIRDDDVAIPDHSDVGEDGPDQCETPDPDPSE